MASRIKEIVKKIIFWQQPVNFEVKQLFNNSKSKILDGDNCSQLMERLLLHLLLIIQAKRYSFSRSVESITPRSTSLTPRNIQERNLHVYKRSIVSTNKQEHLSTIKDVKWTFKHAQLTISNTKRKSLTSSDNHK